MSVPDELFEQADQAAGELGFNRSQLYAAALVEYLRARGPDPVTARLDELADELAADTVGDGGRLRGRRLVDNGEWEW